MSQLKAGFARVNITPMMGIRMRGYFHERLADGVLDDLELAYCMSVHKSQGSEFDAVVLPLTGGPPMLMTRNLLYTAVTRAKRLVVIVGRESCVRQMVDNNHILTRYSALDWRLSGASRRKC